MFSTVCDCFCEEINFLFQVARINVKFGKEVTASITRWNTEQRQLDQTFIVMEKNHKKL